ncbi:hypothetical protein [Crocinitomix catalasitica]|uniref:hypothetical protein n=1 Tax=Crocinitomix catalasitica TaxID=184607 RepID=UPI0004808607|nr:hypothetical protein [Crocinitomix catalasitica]
MGFWKKIFDGINEAFKKKEPEDYYETEITETYVKVTHPKRETEQIEWNEIDEIKLINTDQGPWLPDVWLVLSGNGKECAICQGSEGWDKVYDIVSKYENFNL